MSAAAQETIVEVLDISRQSLVRPQNAPREITHTITLVPPEYVHALRFDVSNYLEKAAARSNGRWSLDTLLDAIVKQYQHLWLAFDKNNQIDGVGTTEFISYPCKRMLAVQFLGGSNFNDWVWDMIERFNGWAKDNYCDGIEVTGRSGFGKWLEQDGYKRCFTVFEKRFDNHE